MGSKWRQHRLYLLVVKELKIIFSVYCTTVKRSFQLRLKYNRQGFMLPFKSYILVSPYITSIQTCWFSIYIRTCLSLIGFYLFYFLHLRIYCRINFSELIVWIYMWKDYDRLTYSCTTWIHSWSILNWIN